MAERPDDLAAELRDLAGWIDVPPPPDVRHAVRLRIETTSGGRRWSPRLVAAAIAVAVALVLVGLPQGRAAVAHAVDRVLRFAGVEIEHGQPVLPPTPSPLPSVRSVALDEARRVAGFPIGVPAALGAPERVELADPGPTGAPRVVTQFYRGGTLRLDEFDGELDLGFVKQIQDPGVDWVRMDTRYALWLPTAHAIEYIDRQGTRHHETARLAGPTLVWQDGAVTYRLEGATSRDDAVGIARTVR
jgi:hypothetical protein